MRFDKKRWKDEIGICEGITIGIKIGIFGALTGSKEVLSHINHKMSRLKHLEKSKRIII